MSTKQDLGTEKWYMSRRLWGSITSAIAAALVYLMPESQNEILTIIGFFAAIAGIAMPAWSWAQPKTGQK